MSKSLMIDIDDPRAEKIAEVMSNKTAKQILSIIVEKEIGVGDISKELKIPINTVMYNVEKLVSAGLIEKSSWIWSTKGKRMDKYKVSNKKIIISPKKLAGIVPAMIISGVVALAIKMFSGIGSNNLSGSNANVLQTTLDAKLVASASSAVAGNVEAYSGKMDFGGVVQSCGGFIANNSWAWFLLGAMVVIFVYLTFDLLNERRYS